MKPVRKRRIFAVITAALTALITTSSVLVGVISAAPDPSKIDKILVDCRSESAFSETSAVYEHTPSVGEPDPYTGGRYSFDEEMQAMHVEYALSDVQADYRVMTKFTETVLTNDYKYFVVVYAAKTDMPYRMTLWNSAGHGNEVVIAENGKDTGGEWVISDAFDISQSANGGATILYRWKSGSINTIAFESEDTDAAFFIKEYAFFKSPEDAKAYYGAVDVNGAPVLSDAQWLIPLTYVTVDEPKTEDDTSDEEDTGETLVEPFILAFDEKTFARRGKFVEFGDGTEGKYEFTSTNGVPCLKLKSSPHADLSAYRTMPTVFSGYLQSEHRYLRVTYMTEDPGANRLMLMNNANGKTVVLSDNTGASGGKFITSNAVEIKSNEILDRYMSAVHNALMWSSTSTDSAIYIKEMAFFATESQAYEYYGDEKKAESVDFAVMSFGKDGNAEVFNSDPSYGNAVTSEDGSIVISYAKSTNLNVNYMAKLRYKVGGAASGAMKYVRVLYSANNPDGITGASMMIENDSIGIRHMLVRELTDTNGEFVLSETALLSDAMIQRFVGGTPLHNSVIVNTSKPGGEYVIKALYFFETRSGADRFSLGKNDHTIAVNGNDISKYKIVVDSDGQSSASESIVNAAKELAAHVSELTGEVLTIVTDKSTVGEYEIRIGQSSREHTDYTGELFGYSGKLYGNTYVITGGSTASVCEGVYEFLRSFLYDGRSQVPEKIEITDKHTLDGKLTGYTATEIWEYAKNVTDPERLEVTFDTDEGYFTEENGSDNWSYRDGAYVCEADGFALSYIHVYEKDADFCVKLKYSSADTDAMLGLMLRSTAAEAYVKAGYDFTVDEWFIESREGADFYPVRLGNKKAKLTEGEWYTVAFTVDDATASLTVNGETVLTVSNVTHLSPGRAAVFAENVGVSIDTAELGLLSGQGTVLRGVTHIVIPENTYLEGGSVIELRDGSLVYLKDDIAYKSPDGVKWERTAAWNMVGNPNIIRLLNGTLLKISGMGGNIVSQISVDDGRTWTDGGIICKNSYNGTSAGAGNMNDKLTQSATTGRIFYTQSYEAPERNPVNGRIVFCEFYYSDDNGKTWTKSQTASWEIAGLEAQKRFGECKIIECADGTLRMYNSWNDLGCIVYSESSDNGVTWGPIVRMENFVCSRSSMQLVRDSYAENDTTYYMVWSNSPLDPDTVDMTRAALTLARSTDGKNWTVLGDIWRWESAFKGEYGTYLNHMVDPFITVTDTDIIVGSGISEYMPVNGAGDNTYHFAQRQHIWTLDKATLPEGTAYPSFNDVSPSDRCSNAVGYVTENGLFTGMSATEFAPEAVMTRAMYVTVLGRLDGIDTAMYKTVSFGDVVPGAWYASYVEWAAAKGIVNGYGNGIYGVNDSVTVEQACLILARYCGFKRSDTASDVKLDEYIDGSMVSVYAKEAMIWALSNGVYSGIYGRLEPQTPASRAIVAEIFYNYSRAFGE